MRQLVLGFGVGKCGTTSLAHLLNIQPNSYFSHEIDGLHWFGIFSDYHKVIKQIRRRAEKYDFTGDVSYVWIQHLSQMVKLFPGVKFVNMWRDKEETVESFWKSSKNRREAMNTPTQWATPDFWFGMYPFFGFPPSKDQIAHTYDIYHRLTHVALLKYPNRIFSLNVKSLSDLDKVDNLLDFVGIPKDQRVVEKVKANVKGQSSMELFIVPTEDMDKKYKHKMKAGITLEASTRRSL